METKHLTTGATLKAQGDTAGDIEAVISTFDVVDAGGDIVLASAFTDGQEALMTWSHDWNRPIGKGAIRVETDRAVFSGRLWLDTNDGNQAYLKIRNAAELQEYSWGFRVLEAAWIERDGEPIRVISRAELFEASPVLKGEGVGTGTLSLKSGLTLADHSERVLAACTELSGRLRSHAELRTVKEGRVLSEANRARLKAHADALEAIVGDLRALHSATAPTDDGKAAALLAVVIGAQRTLARLNGVAV